MQLHAQFDTDIVLTDYTTDVLLRKLILNCIKILSVMRCIQESAQTCKNH